MMSVASVFRSTTKKALPLSFSQLAAMATPKQTFWSTTPVLKEEEEGAPSAGRRATVNTADLVKVVAENHDLSQAESRRILNTIIDTITDSVVNEKNVSLANFGTFTTVETKQRMGRNPHSGEPLLIPAKTRIRFKPHTGFKKSVSG